MGSIPATPTTSAPGKRASADATVGARSALYSFVGSKMRDPSGVVTLIVYHKTWSGMEGHCLMHHLCNSSEEEFAYDLCARHLHQKCRTLFGSIGLVPYSAVVVLNNALDECESKPGRVEI